MIRSHVRTAFVAALVAAVGAGLAASPARADLKLPAVSPKAVVSQTIGLADFTVTYSRPGVKGRKIWGGLVPYGEVWRTGANAATSFVTTSEATIAGKKVPAGEYSLYTIPGETEWTVPSDRMFVMGDNRQNSTDSRSDQIGMICTRDVIGRAWLRYWPIDTLGILQTPTYDGVPAASPLPTASAAP